MRLTSSIKLNKKRAVNTMPITIKGIMLFCEKSAWRAALL